VIFPIYKKRYSVITKEQYWWNDIEEVWCKTEELDSDKQYSSHRWFKKKKEAFSEVNIFPKNVTVFVLEWRWLFGIRKCNEYEFSGDKW